MIWLISILHCFRGTLCGGYQNQPINRSLNQIGDNDSCKENLGRPIDCNDIATGCPSGVYMIYPRNSSGFKTYCEMDMDEGHWTVSHQTITFMFEIKSESLVHHNGNKFSSKDRDNDNHSSHCAHEYKGAWWFNSCVTTDLNGGNVCVTADLNGEYYMKTPASAHHGVYWGSWNGSDYSLKASVMMLRRSG